MSPTGFRVISEQRRARFNYRLAWVNIVFIMVQVYNLVSTVFVQGKWYGYLFVLNIGLHVWFSRMHFIAAKKSNQEVMDQLERYATRRCE